MPFAVSARWELAPVLLSFGHAATVPKHGPVRNEVIGGALVVPGAVVLLLSASGRRNSGALGQCAWLRAH